LTAAQLAARRTREAVPRGDAEVRIDTLSRDVANGQLMGHRRGGYGAGNRVFHTNPSSSMASGFTQAHRNLAVTTPLGTDKLLLAGLTGTEQISDLFHFELEMWSEDAAIKPEDIVGQKITAEVRLKGDASRYFNGLVKGFCKGVRRDALVQYRAEVVPWLWLLTRTTDCKIFQNKTVPAIIEEVFGEYGLTDYQTSGIQAAHPELEYCVQYRETDFAFVSRLMEREGIFYYFDHQEGQHTLVLADGNTAFQDNPTNEVAHAYSVPRDPARNQIRQWEHRYEYRSGKSSQTDYNFIDQPAGNAKTPGSLLMTEAESVLELERITDFERYDYPGGYQKKSDGATCAKTRMEEDESPFHVVSGVGACGQFAPGTKFKMAGHDDAGEVGKGYAQFNTEFSAKPSRLRPRQAFGSVARASLSRRPIPQIRSCGLASTSTACCVPTRYDCKGPWSPNLA